MTTMERKLSETIDKLLKERKQLQTELFEVREEIAALTEKIDELNSQLFDLTGETRE